MKQKGMILGAGFGTRLKPLTDNIPKALVEYKGKPMVVHQIERLKKLGVDEIIVNAHHFAGKMESFFNENNFGVKIILVSEDKILGTGGGILNVEEYLKNSDYFWVINADIDTDFDLNLMREEWEKEKPLAMLLVQKRKTSRYLGFDENMNLLKRAKWSETGLKPDGTDPNAFIFAFNGIHIISPRIFDKEIKVEFKDIIEMYIKLSKEGEKIKGFDAGNSSFKDLGKIEDLV
ncbi:MAG TPA: sugar phosphate nucleotidyltransferase [Ignavibacteria bacterium]|nr:sugar phosphate nucleotidyltransferase [Ignavibacteria bacterium]